MASANHGTFRRDVERIFNQGSLTGEGEGQLLRQYATRGDEAAFEALVTRHGPMVLSVCRRMLYDPRDVDDAFQATFLVLLRRAGSLGDTDPLSPWLHGVAYRVAARIRGNAARRRAEERTAARPEATELACDVERNELRGILDEEIHRLPEKYRRPVVLCYLEGRTQEEAARRLRCTAGSVRGRLDRARAKLRSRLVRRGMAPTAALIASALGAETAFASVPLPLLAGTIATLGRAATARAVAAAGVSAAVCELADGLIRTMFLAKFKLATSFVAAGAIVLALGIVLVATLPHLLARDGQDIRAGAAPARRDTTEIPRISQARRAVSSIDLLVVDHRTGAPLAGVALTVKANRKDAGHPATDNAGHAAIPVPSPVPGYLAVSARKQGFAPMTGFIRRSPEEGDIPASYTLAMHSVETVTGVVRDEQGRPIEGVRVEVQTWMRAGAGGTDRDEFDRPPPVRTDAQGRWKCEGMPAGIPSGRVSFRFSHADYQPVVLPGGTALEFIARGAATVLPRGLEIVGAVVDRAGKRIPGARVYRGADRFGSDMPHTDTGAEGQFRFDHVPAGETILTVQATGHAPDLRKIVVDARLRAVEFRLEPGRTIRGRVVDGKGNPLATTTIVADGWRGYRTLDWRTKSDAEGRFEWPNAPPDGVWVDVMRTGYLRISRRELPPAAGELTITMIKELKVRGTVVDAETRHAVQSFVLVPGSERGGDWTTYWERDRARPLSAGRYEITFDRSSRDGYRLRIEADGYLPEISRPIHDDEDEPVINFVLHNGSGVSGLARSPDGSALAGADVVLVTPSQPAFITNGQPPDRDGNRVVKTGPDGRFAFPAQEPPYSIVVLHDRGFAEQKIGATPAPTPVHDMTVTPWGRVEGTLRIGTRPWAGQSLNLAYSRNSDTPSATPWWDGKSQTEESGRFVLERVMPGEVSVSRSFPTRTTPSSTSWSHSHTTLVDVEPGETARVLMGGSGRTIIGKVTVPGAISGPVDWSCSRNWLTRKQSPINPPAGLDALAKQKWHEAWSRSPEGRAYRRAQRWYGVKLEHDGSFRVEDVEAGTYDLLITVTEPPLDPHTVGFGDSELGSARQDVIVSAMPGGRSDEPLDLGVIPLKPAKKRAVVNVGDRAPAFHIETLDGKPLSLADYTGKYVLLDFWATWCGPCLAETPHLKGLFEAFGNDERFVMVGLSLDQTQEDPRQYAVKHGLGWVQGFLGDWDQAKLPEQYGARGIPSIWLIGPDGKVIAKDLRGGQIPAAVARALGRP